MFFFVPVRVNVLYSTHLVRAISTGGNLFMENLNFGASGGIREKDFPSSWEWCQFLSQGKLLNVQNDRKVTHVSYITGHNFKFEV